MAKIVKVECAPVSTPLKKPVIMPNTRITSIDSVVLAKDGEAPPTAANVRRALEIVREAGPDDTVVLFLAERGGELMPDSAELIRSARGERDDELTGLR